METENQTNLTQSQKKVDDDQKFLLPKVESKYDQYFKKISELRAGDVIVSPHCKFCNHPLRAEAEQKWELSKGNHGKGSYAFVLKFFNDNVKDIKFNYQNVTVHLNHHYEQQLKRLWLREYGSHLADIMNYKVSKDEDFEALIQANKLKLFEIAANPDLDLVKQADMMVKLTKVVLDINVVQAKLRGDIDTIDVYKDKFHEIMVKFIATEKDTDRQRRLVEQLDLAREEVIQGA